MTHADPPRSASALSTAPGDPVGDSFEIDIGGEPARDVRLDAGLDAGLDVVRLRRTEAARGSQDEQRHGDRGAAEAEPHHRLRHEQP